MTTQKCKPFPFDGVQGQDDDSKQDDGSKAECKTLMLYREGAMDFSDLGKMKEMMGQAKQMQEQMEKKLAATVVEASSGGGVVTVRMNGKKEVLRVKIEPTAMGSSASDLELLEDLIAAAVNEAGRRADEAMKSSVAGMMGGLGLPDLPGLG
jgi:DNA-binding YbaB/EbfC family protein